MSSRKRKSAPSSSNSRRFLDLGGTTKRNYDTAGDDDTSIDSRSSEEAEEPTLVESSDEEDPEQRKIQLAKEYLQKIQQDDDSSEESEEEQDDPNDVLSRKLQRKRLKTMGTYEQFIADKYKDIQADTQYFRGHDLTPTSIAMTQDGTLAISSSKDHSVIVWKNGKKLHTLQPHWKNNSERNSSSRSRSKGQVLAVTCSDDGKYFAYAGNDACVHICTADGIPYHTFSGHKHAITALCFRASSHQLFSASEDRTIKYYDVDQKMFLETLFGHQFGVTNMDCHVAERPVSVGKDRTARLWKIEEDTHLIYRGGARMSYAESVSVIKDKWFITGHQDGQLALWYSEKKKAVHTVQLAHGQDESGQGHPVLTVKALPYSDLVWTGSCDGFLRLWKVSIENKVNQSTMEEVFRVPIKGFINDISIGSNGGFCMLAIGQEHKMGRWKRIKGARNRIAKVTFHREERGENSSPNESLSNTKTNMANTNDRETSSSDDESSSN